MKPIRWASLVLLLALPAGITAGQTPEPDRRWILLPDTTLGGRASNQIPARPEQPITPPKAVRTVEAEPA